MNIEDIFRRAEEVGVDGSFSRVSDTHPAPIFLGLDGGRRSILVVSRERPPEAPGMGALQVDIRFRQSGDWVLMVRLERPEFSRLFARLVDDLVDSTSTPAPRPEVVVVERLGRWKRMFSRGPSSLLEDYELRGLVGELSFLVDEAIPSVGIDAATRAWLGPYDAPKDFVFADREVEVKATHRQPRALRISSLEQLTDADLPLFLWTRVIELDHAEPDPLRSCAAWVRRARQACESDSSAAQRMEDALLASGWEDRAEYEARIVRAGQTACYSVQEGFPRIERTGAPAGVTDCHYCIDVSSLVPFSVSTWKGAIGDAR